MAAALAPVLEALNAMQGQLRRLENRTSESLRRARCHNCLACEHDHSLRPVPCPNTGLMPPAVFPATRGHLRNLTLQVITELDEFYQLQLPLEDHAACIEELAAFFGCVCL